MTVRLVIADIDGTLVRHDKSLSDGVVAAAQRLQAAGIGMSLISARPPSGMLWIARKLGLGQSIAAFNGGTIARPDGTIVSADRLDPDVAAKVLALLDRPELTQWLFADGNWYARTTDNEHVERERKATSVEPVIVDDLSGLLARVDKLVGISADHDLLADLEPVVKRGLGDRATVARSQPYYLDVTAPTGNKGDGVAALAEAAGVPLADVAVIGDQRNDLAMFARAGLSFAMAQAPEEVRAAADRTTLSNEEDGVAAAIGEILEELDR